MPDTLPREERFKLGWSPLEDKSTNDFLHEWWGRHEKAPLRLDLPGNILTLQDSFWDILGVLGETNGQIFMREEYRTMYPRIVDFRSKQERADGVVITGHPGIGKSYFAVVLFLQCLTAAQPATFSTTSGMTYWVDGDGVRFRPTSSISSVSEFDTGSALRCGDSNTTIWTIVEAPLNREEPIPGWFQHSPEFFYTVFASPDCELLDSMRNGWWRWIMSPWSLEETQALFQIPGMLPPGPGLKTVLDPLEVQRLFLAMGGSPRDIVSLLHNKEQITREIEDAVAALKTPIDIRMLVFHPLGCPTPYPPAVYCRLILLDYYPPGDPDDPGYSRTMDRGLLRVTGDIARRLLQDKIAALKDADVACVAPMLSEEFNGAFHLKLSELLPDDVGKRMYAVWSSVL